MQGSKLYFAWKDILYVMLKKDKTCLRCGCSVVVVTLPLALFFIIRSMAKKGLLRHGDFLVGIPSISPIPLAFDLVLVKSTCD